MSFHRRAWHAGADEYGRRRAEEYGRRAKALVVLGWLASGLLVLGIMIAAQGGFGG